MKIETIIYDTTRELLNIEDKLRIITVFLFCEKLGSIKFSELLYCYDHKHFIDNLNKEFKDYDVDFTIRFDDRNVNSAFYKTLESVKIHYDKDGFLKAIHNRDEFALVICEIVNYNFDAIELKNTIGQLKLNLW